MSEGDLGAMSRGTEALKKPHRNVDKTAKRPRPPTATVGSTDTVIKIPKRKQRRACEIDTA